jgi:hypothetical protein
MDSSMASIQQYDPETGALVASWTPTGTTQDKLRALRRQMYRPGLGTWYWLLITIGPTGEVDSDFHYDEPPEMDGIDFRLEPSAYRSDLEEYPRANGPLPGWLSERLAEPD